MGELFQYMTINEFRRRFFNGKSRPSKKTVIEWIESGNNGVKLKAKFINGAVYISESAALDFLVPQEQPRTKTAASRLIAARNARIEEAKHTLVYKFGFKL